MSLVARLENKAAAVQNAAESFRRGEISVAEMRAFREAMEVTLDQAMKEEETEDKLVSLTNDLTTKTNAMTAAMASYRRGDSSLEDMIPIEAALAAARLRLENERNRPKVEDSPEEVERKRLAALDTQVSYGRWPNKYGADWIDMRPPFFPEVMPPPEKLELRVRSKPLWRAYPTSPIDRYRGVIEIVYNGRAVVLGYVGLRYDHTTKRLEGDGFYNLTQITKGGKAMAAVLFETYQIRLRGLLPAVLFAMLRDLNLGNGRDESLHIYASGEQRADRDYLSTQIDLIRYYEHIGFQTTDGPALTSRYSIRSKTKHITDDHGVPMHASNVGVLMDRLHNVSVASWYIHKLQGTTWNIDVVGPDTKPSVGPTSTRTHRVESPAVGLVPRVVRLQTPEEVELDFPDIQVVQKLMRELHTDLSTNELRVLLGHCLATIKNEQARKKRKVVGARASL